ncbi:MAG: nucleotidyltransferase domain-containing protein [Spirochaetae bacterium HGW-Spirochaetae-5]|nr:MAG: nucleotidyltransferase domain-containing protein [Spirochaetae bacterium HGW-Spirochaetae-5]
MKLPENIRIEIIEALKKMDPEKVILFGSYAWGNPDCDSDIDLYVVTKDDFMPSSWSQKRDIVRNVSRQMHVLREKYAIDIIVHTKPMHKKFIETGSCFSKEIIGSGLELI